VECEWGKVKRLGERSVGKRNVSKIWNMR